MDSSLMRFCRLITVRATWGTCYVSEPQIFAIFPLDSLFRESELLFMSQDTVWSSICLQTFLDFAGDSDQTCLNLSDAPTELREAVLSLQSEFAVADSRIAKMAKRLARIFHRSGLCAVISVYLELLHAWMFRRGQNEFWMFWSWKILQFAMPKTMMTRPFGQWPVIDWLLKSFVHSEPCDCLSASLTLGGLFSTSAEKLATTCLFQSFFYLFIVWLFIYIFWFLFEERSSPFPSVRAAQPSRWRLASLWRTFLQSWTWWSSTDLTHCQAVVWHISIPFH